MSAHSPKDLLSQVEAAFNDGDADALLALYEPDATFVAQPGQTVTGIEEISVALSGFFAIKPVFDLDVRSIVESQDLALVHSNWTIHGTAPDGSPLAMSGSASDVLRRQPDGTWLLAIDNPWGAAA